MSSTNYPRSVIVVLDPATTEIEATAIRNALRMFTGVVRAVPVRGVPNDDQVFAALKRDDLIEARRRAETQRDEAVARLNDIARLSTGLALEPMEIEAAG